MPDQRVNLPPVSETWTGQSFLSGVREGILKPDRIPRKSEWLNELMGKRWNGGAINQIRVGTRFVPVSLIISVVCWLSPGAWSGLGTLVPSLFVPAEIRDSGWFGSGTLAVLAIYTALVMGVPILMLCGLRIARVVLTAVAVCFTAAVFTTPALESVWAYVLVMTGTITMWLPQSNQYLRKRIMQGNGAVL